MHKQIYFSFDITTHSVEINIAVKYLRIGLFDSYVDSLTPDFQRDEALPDEPQRIRQGAWQAVKDALQ